MPLPRFQVTGILKPSNELQLAADDPVPRDEDLIFSKFYDAPRKASLFLIAFQYPYVRYFHYSGRNKGGINKTLRVRIGDELITQDWSGLHNSNYISVSAVLERANIVPSKLMYVQVNGEWCVVYKSYVESILPSDIELYEDHSIAGLIKARFKKPISKPIRAAGTES